MFSICSLFIIAITLFLAPITVPTGWQTVQLGNIDFKELYSQFENRHWILDVSGKVFFSSEDSLNEIFYTESIVSLSEGPAGVWAVDHDGNTIRRLSIDDLNPYGKQWKIVPQNIRMMQVFSGPYGIVLGKIDFVTDHSQNIH